MSKITIIGLGLVGNSIGMALKQAVKSTSTSSGNVQAISGGSGTLQIVGFDPSREREMAALRRFGSVDEIAPDLQRAVQGAQLVILSTPASAIREVLEAIGPMLDPGTTVTDTLAAKEPVMRWAGELLGSEAQFVGGHPLSKSTDLATTPDDSIPSADLFEGAHYCILPSVSAKNEALNRVIWLAETVGAKPLFIDILEHDSFVAAASQLPVVASAALLHITAGGPTWVDMGTFAGDHYDSVVAPLARDPEMLAEWFLQNRGSLVRWIDQYMLGLQELREDLASADQDAIVTKLQRAHISQDSTSQRGRQDAEGRAAMREAIAETSPSRTLMGSYLSGKIFRKRDQR